MLLLYQGVSQGYDGGGPGYGAPQPGFGGAPQPMGYPQQSGGYPQQPGGFPQPQAGGYPQQQPGFGGPPQQQSYGGPPPPNQQAMYGGPGFGGAQPAVSSAPGYPQPGGFGAPQAQPQSYVCAQNFDLMIHEQTLCLHFMFIVNWSETQCELFI